MSYYRTITNSCTTFSQMVDTLVTEGMKRGRAILFAAKLNPKKYRVAMAAGEGNWDRA